MSKCFLKRPDSKYFRIYSHLISATIPQLCRGNTKVAIDNTLTDGRGDLPIKLYVETQSVAWVWLLGHSFLIPFLDHGF